MLALAILAVAVAALPTSPIHPDKAYPCLALKPSSGLQLEYSVVSCEQVMQKRQLANADQDNSKNKVATNSDDAGRKSSNTKKTPAVPSSDKQYANMFNFDIVNCTTLPLVDTTTYCESARRGLTDAGQVLSNVFNISFPINVRVEIYPMCKNPPCTEADREANGSLAAGGPATFTPFYDDDKATRFYPPALVKQLFGGSNIGGEYDISMKINSLYDYHFSRLQPSIYVLDFQNLVTHELMHGMGFLSGYRYDESGDRIWLIPSRVHWKGEQYAAQILEMVFDRYLYRMDGNKPQSLSDANRNPSLDSAMFRNGEVIIPAGIVNESEEEETKHLQAYQYLVGATNTSTDIFSHIATKPRSIAFIPPSSTEPIYVETSLKPFNRGSSMSHLDLQTYATSQDFMMTYRVMNTSLLHTIAKHNELTTNSQLLNDSTWLEANVNQNLAIGPATRRIMQSLGWSLRVQDHADLTLPSSPRFESSTASSLLSSIWFIAVTSLAFILG